MNFTDFGCLLAQAAEVATEVAPVAGDPGATSAPGSGFMQMMIIFGAFLVLMWFMTIRSQQKEQRRHANMIESLKVGDNIVTIGGVCGTIRDINRTKNSFQLLVDDKSNTRLTMLLTAIAYVVEEGKE